MIECNLLAGQYFERVRLQDQEGMNVDEVTENVKHNISKTLLLKYDYDCDGLEHRVIFDQSSFGCL